MARVRDGVLTTGAQLGLYLDRYQELMGLDVCAFNGINKPTDSHDNQCIDIVGQTMRDNLATFLLQAEEMREEELGYYVAPKWHSEWIRMGAGNPFALSKKHLIEVGYPTATLITAGVVLNHGADPLAPTDPVVITIATTVTIPEEIVVTYPGELVVIHPCSVSISGGIATIRIPRCRLVDPDYNDDWDDPPGYYDAAVFLNTVDIYRVYADVSNGAAFVWANAGCSDSELACATTCQVACPVIVGEMAYELSLVNFFPALYSSGAWSKTCFTYSSWPEAVRVTYKSGRQSSINTELSTIRLAHTLMPFPPCQCDIALHRWESDRQLVERQWSPYGSMVGAIDTWMKDSRHLVGHGGMFPRLIVP